MRKGSVLLLTGAAAAGALLAGSRWSPAPAGSPTALWYARLEKPSFTPPGAVFGVVWPVLDALLWFTGYRLARARPGPARLVALGAWTANLAGMVGYPYVFFGRKRPDEGLAVTGAMLGASAGLVASAAEVDRPAAWATVPLVGWLLFATVLQEEVWRRNK